MQLQETLNLAFQHHQAGRLAEAEVAYCKILTEHPNCAEAHHLLGVLAHQCGNNKISLELLSRAVQLEPRAPQYHLNLAVVLHALDRPPEAAAEYERAAAIQPQPRDPVYLANLAKALNKLGRLNQAIVAAQTVVELLPDSAESHLALAGYLCDAKSWDQAMMYCAKAIALMPDWAQAYAALGSIYRATHRHDDFVRAYRQAVALDPNNDHAIFTLAEGLTESQEWDEAVRCCEMALAISPRNATVHNLLADALLALQRNDGAAAAYQQALAIQPNLPEARNNLGLALYRQGRLDDAIAAYHDAITNKRNFAEAHNNLGIALATKGQIEEAIAAYQQAIEFAADYPSAHWNLGLALLTKGDFQRGWAEYDWRWRVKDFAFPADYSKSMWAGQPLDGKRILVHSEQGLGDTLQFSRYVPLIQKAGGTVIFQCDQSLHRLFRQTWPDVEYSSLDSPCPAHDVHCPLMSLPKVFRTTLATIPTEPYLTPNPDLARHWQSRLPHDSPLKVGFVWANRPIPPDRCPPPADWSLLAQAKAIWLCSLQKDNAGDKPPGLQITDWTAELCDFADTAALIANLDRVITVDTAVAHLAGAMGKPVWLLLKKVPDWRWMLDRPDSPWYPTMRLFRQPTLGDWKTPISQIVQRLIAAL